MATSTAIITWKNGIMQLSLGNMKIELNVLNVIKQPHNDDNEVTEVDMIETPVDNSFVFNLCDDPFEKCLTDFGLSFDIDTSIEEVNALVNSVPVMDTTKLKARVEPPPPF